MTNKLVAYFSATGTTRQKAQQLAGALGADVYEIVPKQPYTNADLNWMDKTSRSSLEMNDPDSRPEIADNAIDVSTYDTIYAGFPIWWYVAPRIMGRFWRRMILRASASCCSPRRAAAGLARRSTS